MTCIFCKMGKCVSPGHSSAVPVEKWATKAVGEKKKTGDKELVRLLLQAWVSLAERKQEEYEQALTAYMKAEEQYDKGTRDSFLPLKEDTLKLLVGLGYGGGSIKPYGDPSKLEEEDVLGLRGKLLDIYLELLKLGGGCDSLQFVANLCLVNYRTAKGGRLRKSTSGIRSKHESEYSRPFLDALPLSATFLLSVLTTLGKNIRAKNPFSNQGSKPIAYGSLSQVDYFPPVRFTASFLTSGTKIEDFSSHYEELGSFGFAEPSFSDWKQGYGGGEYAGTRVSLGAYSTNPDYLEEFSKRLELTYEKEETRTVYKKYGGARPKHVNYLRQRFGSSQSESKLPVGLSLSVAWLKSLLETARKIVKVAAGRCKPLEDFLTRIDEKLAKREGKLGYILQQGAGLMSEGGLKATSLFDKVWILEATIWELMFLGASMVPLADLVNLLGSEDYTPAVGADVTLVEDIHLAKDDVAFTRVFFPSGTAAATSLHEFLGENECSHHKENFDSKELTHFRPYFEFYIPGAQPKPNETQEAAFLYDKPEKEEGRRAVWVNLSESLHAGLIKHKLKDVGEVIAGKLKAYLKTLQWEESVKVLVVADFTKFCGEMPNSVVYRILYDLASSLSGTCECVFLRSNLKYNSGSLDRYQTGEVLIPPVTAKWLSPDELRDKAEEIFNNPDTTCWSLFGQYGSLMRKTYLLSDYVSHSRWKEYAK